MKALIWYCKKLELSNVKPNGSTISIDNKINSPKKIKEKKVLCPWITIENGEDVNYFGDFEKDLKKLSLYFKTEKVVLLPFVHFVSKIHPYEYSFGVLLKLKDYLEAQNYDVKLAHFGSSKDFKFFSPADEKQVVMRSYGKEEDNLKEKVEKKQAIKKSNKTVKKEAPKKSNKKITSSPKKLKQKKSGKTLRPTKGEKNPVKKEWVSSLYNLAPSSRKK